MIRRWSFASLLVFGLLACGTEEVPVEMPPQLLLPEGAVCAAPGECSSGHCVDVGVGPVCTESCMDDCDCGSRRSCASGFCVPSERNVCVDPRPPHRCGQDGQCLTGVVSAELEMYSSFNAGVSLRPVAWIGDELIVSGTFIAESVSLNDELHDSFYGPDRHDGGTIVARVRLDGSVRWSHTVDAFRAVVMVDADHVVVVGTTNSFDIEVRMLRFDADGEQLFDVVETVYPRAESIRLYDVGLTPAGLEFSAEVPDQRPLRYTVDPWRGDVLGRVIAAPHNNRPPVRFPVAGQQCEYASREITCEGPDGEYLLGTLEFRSRRGNAISVRAFSPFGNTTWLVGQEYNFDHRSLGHRVYMVTLDGIEPIQGPENEEYVARLSSVAHSPDGRVVYYAGTFVDQINDFMFPHWDPRRNSWFIAAHDAATDEAIWTQAVGPGWADSSSVGMRVSASGHIATGVSYERTLRIGGVELVAPLPLNLDALGQRQGAVLLFAPE